MKFLKRIQLIFLVLFPVCLMGMEQHSSQWIQEARACQQYGSWTGLDKTGKPVIVEGEVISRDSRIVSSGAYVESLNTMADVMQVPDLEWIRSYPLVALNPLVLFLYAKLYCQGKQFRDWIYDSYMERIDEAASQVSDEVHYLFTVKELDSEKLLGIVMFQVGKEHEHGTVELGPLAVTPEAQGRGLSKILTCSILKLLPQTNRIILEALCSNTKAIDIYKSFGFTQYQRDNGMLNILVCAVKCYIFAYEYMTDTCQKLQACAATLKDIKV